MHLQELLATEIKPATQGVPDWMLGYFKRYAISFADGRTDLETNVCWLQSRNFTLDLRLPIATQQVTAKAWQDYTKDELLVMADYEGWEALCDWKDDILSWRNTDTSLQLHNRWVEPGVLKRIGNCMIELSPSGAYVEDWRLQPSSPGHLVGLRLLEERVIETGEVRHSGGGLIFCGDYAGLVLGRSQTVTATQAYNSLRAQVVEAHGQPDKLAALFNFETSVAQGSISQGYRISMSTKPERVGEYICPLDGFEFVDISSSEAQLIRQTLTFQGELCERIFEVDTIEQNVGYEQVTSFTPEAKTWYQREEKTLTRYSKPIF
ncbi:hypothetical protein [Paraglaciecola sp. L3A3]|uniref:hypothetical protein n=1 Tax=Paraglaciecola sp. L3A3 TaxID=2686358 RepID=UPI00131D1F25|nr:hypothetical protein [Paraglaciecola sp. L3A3]